MRLPVDAVVDARRRLDALARIALLGRVRAARWVPPLPSALGYFR
jgi:hypothetical protein